MKIKIKGYNVQGTPKEIKELIFLISQNDGTCYDTMKPSFDKPKILLCSKNN